MDLDRSVRLFLEELVRLWCLPQGQAIFNQTFSLELIIAVVVFALVTVTLLAGAIAGRARPGRRPSRKSKHTRLEFVYVLMVTGMTSFLFTNSIVQNGKEMGYAARPAVTVAVTGFQWCWKFAYQGTPVVVTGRSRAYAHAARGRPGTHQRDLCRRGPRNVGPYMCFKLEAIPGYTHAFTSVLDRTGTFPGRCSEFCGRYHWAMVFRLHVVNDGAFERWLTHQERTTASIRPGR